MVGDLRRVRLPYHLSALTQTAGIVALHHREDASALLGSIRVQRDRIVRELRMLGLDVYPTDANFVLFLTSGCAARLAGVARPRRADPRHDRGRARWLRVTAGAEHETDRFLSALKEVLAR